MLQVKATPKSKREDQLQFLRFLAFLNIFALHADHWLWVRYPFWNGAVSAVSFFFILSGAMVGYNGYAKQRTVSLKSVGMHIWRKLCKLYPLYFLAVYASVLCSGLPGSLVSYDLAGAVPQLKMLGRHLLLLQSWFPVGYFDYSGVGWYLSVTFFLYVLEFPLAALLGKMAGKRDSWAWFAGSMLLCVLGTAAYSYATYSGDRHFWQYIFPPARIGQYFAGMILGYGIRSLKEKQLPVAERKAAYTAAEIAVVMFWLLTLQLPDESWHNRLLDWMLPNLLVIGVFLLGQGGISTLFRWKPLVCLGDISFGCYLFHQLLIHIFSVISDIQPFSRLGGLICAGICLVGTLLFAFRLDRPAKK